MRSLVRDNHFIDHQDTVFAQGGDRVGQERQRLFVRVVVQDVAHIVHTRALVRLRVPKVEGLTLHAGDGDRVGQEEGLLLEDDPAGQGGVHLLEQRALLPDAAANVDEQGRAVVPRGRRRRLVGVRWQVEHVEEGLLAVMKLAHPEAELAQEPGLLAGPDECRLVRRHGHLEGRVDDVVGIFVSCVLEELGGGEEAAGANLEAGRGSISTEGIQGSQDAVNSTYACVAPAWKPGRAKVLVTAFAVNSSSPVSAIRSLEARKRRMRPGRGSVMETSSQWGLPRHLTKEHRICLGRLGEDGAGERALGLSERS